MAISFAFGIQTLDSKLWKAAISCSAIFHKKHQPTAKTPNWILTLSTIDEKTMQACEIHIVDKI